jgi:hypothetical protein
MDSADLDIVHGAACRSLDLAADLVRQSALLLHRTPCKQLQDLVSEIELIGQEVSHHSEIAKAVVACDCCGVPCTLRNDTRSNSSSFS